MKLKNGGGSCSGYTFDLNAPIARDMATVIPYAPNCQAGGKRNPKKSQKSKKIRRNRK